MTATGTNYHIDQHGTYSAVTLLPGMNNAQWSDIEQAGTDIMGRLNGTRSPAVLVDLTPLNYMGSSMVAMIVRCWKNVQSNNGKIVVVCNNEVVREVISLAGLTKVWPIVENREDGLKALGISSSYSGGMEKILAIVGMVAALIGLIGAVLLTMGTVDPNVAKGLLFAGSAVGFVLGLITLMRTADPLRLWGLGVVIACAAIAVFGLVQRPANLAANPAIPLDAAEAETPETIEAPDAKIPPLKIESRTARD